MTTGSVQAPETLYWGLAAVYAKAGYVVLTYDVQGQGQSDTFGKARIGGWAPVTGRSAGRRRRRGRLDFMLSAADRPYDPRPSCGSANGGAGADRSPERDAPSHRASRRPSTPPHSLVDPPPR